MITQTEVVELIDLYHLARVRMNSRYERMLWATREFVKTHVDISGVRAYKALDEALR